MKFSVIIPARNAERTISGCLKAIFESDFRDFEVIVVDDKSSDKTARIAGDSGAKVICAETRMGMAGARNRGFKEAGGDVLCFIDSDVEIKRDTLGRIYEIFKADENTAAVTGLLSREHPNKNFFSQYKNLYMNHMFSRLPRKVSFLYGSIHALRKELFEEYDETRFHAADTELGQRLSSKGLKVIFDKDLEVVHLKKHNLFSMIKNDFRISYNWALIFLKYRGWLQLGRHGTGYAHSPKEQIVSVVLAPFIFPVSYFLRLPFWAVSALIGLWLILNIRFFIFLAKEKGLVFGLLAIFVTFIDNIIMALGILSGSIGFLLHRRLNFLIV